MHHGGTENTETHGGCVGKIEIARSSPPPILCAMIDHVQIETEREVDGRWIADIPAIPGVMVYGESRDDAIQRVKALALRVIAEKTAAGEVCNRSTETGPAIKGPTPLARLVERQPCHWLNPGVTSQSAVWSIVEFFEQ